MSRTRPMLDRAFRAYKALLSPLLHALSPTQCKFLPTCSEYAYIAIARHGALRGGMMALGRLARCHPWSRGGLDHVPEAATLPGAPRVAASTPQSKSRRISS